LSGKYGSEKRPDRGRLTSNKEYISRYGENWVFETAGGFTDLANARGVHPVSLAVAWAATHPAVTCPIIGARNLEQLMPSLEAPGIDMSEELRAEISRLGRTPPPATDRLEEQG
jgi:aryl-alcohol dehydrogenase-like predicted oxidoreductase